MDMFPNFLWHHQPLLPMMTMMVMTTTTTTHIAETAHTLQIRQQSPFLFLGKTHGAPGDDASQRTVGDLGNIEGDESGNCDVKISDNLVKLLGAHSVIGRSIVVCAGADDGGRGGQEKSLTTGNAGPRVAYGVIGMGSS